MIARIELLFSLVAMLLLVGCANKLLGPEAVSKTTLSDTTGLLIGSFARNPEERSFYMQSFVFRNKATGEVHRIASQQSFNIFNGKTSDDFETETSEGGLFVFALPAGEYEFYNFSLYDAHGYGSTTFFSKEDYSIPFHVEANAANYVGEIRLEQVMGKNFFGLSVHAGGFWILSDERKRDLALMKEQHPEVPLQWVLDAIPQRKDIFTPLVILPSEVKKNPGALKAGTDI